MHTSPHRLTSQQQVVVEHPKGMHARVLAVAGSGKTTTMAYRVRHLVLDHKISPKKIAILMFNRNARVQFQDKLTEVGLPNGYQPQVNTFHSYAFQLIGFLQGKGVLPGFSEVWADESAEKLRRAVLKAIDSLVKREAIPPDAADSDEAMEAISLWKSSLIPPNRAGYVGNPAMPMIYQEFEDIRNSQGAITYDDFVPIAVEALERFPQILNEFSSFDYIIVDEYQDVNFGQQRLVELLAGQHADVMVVGDDDQTIYEWRGARPDYILKKFQTVFSNKPHRDYKLSHSFRFGPVIAQSAQNVISFNRGRIEKPLIAFNARQAAEIVYIEDDAEQKTESSKELAQLTVNLVRDLANEGKSPKEIVVLGRMYSQLSNVEVEYLTWKIPYKVIGRSPFFERREIQALLDYLRLADQLDDPLDVDVERLLLSVANTPNRKINKQTLRRAANNASARGGSARGLLNYLAKSFDTPLSTTQAEAVGDLLQILSRLKQLAFAQETSHFLAGDGLEWLIDNTEYLQHFDNYYGMGEASEDRKRGVHVFCDYAHRQRLSVPDFLEHLQTLDTTRGQPDEDLIRLTTVFRTKGDEFEYVIIPSCEEGYMPCLFGTPNLTYDTLGTVTELPSSAIIENERRLFYVALTRARRAVFIEASAPPRLGRQSKTAAMLPSRFIYEMQMEPTKTVMGAVRAVAARLPQADRSLADALHKHAGLKPMMENIVNFYLNEIGLGSQAGKVKQLVARVPTVPFVYPYEYKMPELISSRNTRNEKTPGRLISETLREPKWWQDDDLPF